MTDRRKIFIFLIAFCFLKSLAQDLHFSQFWMQPLYLNAANAGMFDGDYRVGGMYRNQWRAVPVPYKTTSFMGDMRIKNIFGSRNHLGIGLMYHNDVSGDSHYTINQAYMPISFIKNFANDSNLTVSFGLSPGVSNVAFQTGQLTYDSQFNGDGFSSSLPSGENYPTLTKTYFDLGGGLVIQYKLKGLGLIKAGTSFSHINQPTLSFYNNNSVKLYGKSTSFIGLTLPIPQSPFLVHLDGMYAQQGPFHETILAARLSYLLNQKDNIRLYAGLSSRLADAGIFLVGMDYKKYQFGFAYDLNYSKFQAATNKRGAWEVSILYIINKIPVFMPKRRTCPTYM